MIEFVILEPNTPLVKEGDMNVPDLYIILNGRLDIRKVLPAKKTLREIG